MKNFMDEDFLLKTPTAKQLFSYCKDEPIFDWHCHLSSKEIYENKQPETITELWLYGDHYKWAVMRACGVDEKYITGDASDYEKFVKYAYCMEKCIGNPVYHWTHLELQRYFDIYTPLSSKTADEIYHEANKKIAEGGFTPRELIKRSNVVCVCTTDDPSDSLEYHEKITADESFPIKVYPAFRPDKSLNIANRQFADSMAELSNAAEIKIDSFDSLKAALAKRVDFFDSLGCRAADCSLTEVHFIEADDEKIEKIFKKALAGEYITFDEEYAYKSALLKFLFAEYKKKDWGSEVHLGALRNTNTKMFDKIGVDTGFDTIGDSVSAVELSKLLDASAKVDSLPKTILFNLNPSDNYMVGAMIHNFQSNGNMQYGSGWWFNDNIDGMKAQLRALSNLGVLGEFIGMVTDSRSFLSYPRHEYFRRVLCDYLGDLVENGEYPYDEEILKQTVQNISFNNARKYFNLQ